MSEYINRDDALNCFHDWVDKHGDVVCADDTAEYIEIANLPIIELVRCKDCIWYLKDGSCARHLKQFESYDFCSYGERGETDE